MPSTLLDKQRIPGLHRATIDAGLVVQRTALLQGIDKTFVDGLPLSQSPSAQVLNDLHGLNVVLADGSVPLGCWLENAFLLAGPQAAAAVFKAGLLDLGLFIPLSAPDPVERRECPFPGLAFFDEAMAGFFFGRSEEIDEAIARLGDTAEGHRRWLQIEGPSGAGKSSLARAGLVPAIRKGRIVGAPDQWRVAIFRPGTNPIRALAREVRKALEDRDPPSLEALVEWLHGSPRALGEILGKYVREGEGFLLVVDQLEEAFTLADEIWRAELDALLAGALPDDNHGSLYLVTTIRSDFVGRFEELPALASLLNIHEKVDRYFLKGMSARGLQESVEGPTRLAGIKWEDGLATRVLTDASESKCELPLLAHALRALWLGSEERILTHRAYEALGRVGGALAKSADKIVDDLGPEGK